MLNFRTLSLALAMTLLAAPAFADIGISTSSGGHGGFGTAMPDQPRESNTEYFGGSSQVSPNLQAAVDAGNAAGEKAAQQGTVSSSTTAYTPASVLDANNVTHRSSTAD